MFDAVASSAAKYHQQLGGMKKRLDQVESAMRSGTGAVPSLPPPTSSSSSVEEEVLFAVFLKVTNAIAALTGVDVGFLCCCFGIGYLFLTSLFLQKIKGLQLDSLIRVKAKVCALYDVQYNPSVIQVSHPYHSLMTSCVWLKRRPTRLLSFLWIDL